MTFAIVSDLHANLQAWNAVLLDIRARGIEHIVCLGDIVGYGPNPAEVLHSVHAHVHDILLGNHDAVVAGLIGPEDFNPRARSAIEWTCQQVSSDARTFLGSLPLCLTGPAFRCTHGDFSDPGAFHYVLEPDDALRSWSAVPEPLLFVGHSHEPAIFVRGRSGRPHSVAPQDFELEAGKQFLVNVGSVGQPRDRDYRASYCIYDPDRASVFFRKVPFDLEAYRAALDASDLPEKNSAFLRFDPRHGVPPLRESLVFSPPPPERALHKDDEVQALTCMGNRLNRWRRLAIATALTATLCLASGLAAWWHQTHRAWSIVPAAFSPVEAESVPASGITARQRTAIPETHNLLGTLESPDAGSPGIPGWAVEVSERRRQQVTVEAGKDTPASIRMSSTAPLSDLVVRSRPIRVRAGDRFRFYAEVGQTNGFRGELEFMMDLTCDGQPLHRDWQRFVADTPHEGWRLARKVFPPPQDPLPTGDLILQVRVQGRFQGTVCIRQIGLARLEQ
jgi:predicted phosphodiesterase